MDDELIFKICTKCGENLPATTEYFHKKKSGKYGLHAICKKCIKEYNKTRFENNKDEILEKKRKYNSNNKEKIREYNKDYYKDNTDKKKELSKKYRENNKEYYREYNKKYYEDNKEQLKSYNKDYRINNAVELSKKQKEYVKNNPDKIFNNRQKHRNYDNSATVNKISKEQWRQMLDFFDNKCAYSGEELTEENFSIDHIIPISKGGDNSINNIVPCTKSVNLSKWNYDLEEWYIDKEFFSRERLLKIYEWKSLIE